LAVCFESNVQETYVGCREMQNIYIPIRARKTGVVSFTASKKVFITTITSVLNSIFIAFLF